jgi:hypothetical protein
MHEKRRVFHQIKDLDGKIKFLNGNEFARRVMGHSDRFESFILELGRGEKASLPRKTLQSQMDAGRMPSENVQLLAKKLKFDPEWPEWRHGTKEAFKRRYEREHGAPVDQATLLSVTRRKKPVSRMDELGLVEIKGIQPGQGTLAIGAEVVCGNPVVGETRVSVRSARLVLECGQRGRLTLACGDGWRAGGRLVGRVGGDVRVDFRGTQYCPSWRLCADGPAIDRIELDPDFASLEHLAPGDVVVAKLKVFVGHIRGSNDEVTIVPENGSALRISIKKLPVLKQRAIDCLRNDLLQSQEIKEDVTNTGYVTVARDELEVVEAES